MTFPPASSSGNAKQTANRIGRFRIVRELGRGTIGLVYLGHDPVIDRSVAIKTFNPRLTSGEKKQYEEQFINEARAAGRLSHPNIITIFDASSESGTTYIAMEYLEGHELSQLLNQGKRFDPDEVASIVAKVADALAYAHKHGVVHRDIKPANIFLVEDNNPKLVDFGIARAPNRVSGQPGHTDKAYTLYRNNLLGTPNYMSPEQAAGKQVDLRTDIYSLGAVMYEMLAGRKPFKSRDTTALLQMIAHKTPPAPHAINPDVPLMLSHIAMKAMGKRKDKRYQHADEMAADLKRYMARQKRSQRRANTEAIPAAQPEASAPAGSRRSLLLFGLLVSLAVLAWFRMRMQG